MESIALQGKLQSIPDTSILWQDLVMDFLINLPEDGGSMSILVVIDRFSKMVHLIPLLSSTEAKGVVAAFFDSVGFHGLPSTIISNRDPHF